MRTATSGPIGSGHYRTCIEIVPAHGRALYLTLCAVAVAFLILSGYALTQAR
jgi:hypothetical protein